MKNKTEPSLEELRKEIEKLKIQKKGKLQFATSITERNKLLSEINQLDAVQKSPNALRNFGKTFGKGLSMVGKTLWKGITTASRNIDTNVPEVKKIVENITYKPKQMKKEVKNITYKPKQIKKTTKKSKSKKRMKKARKMVYNSQPKPQPKQQNLWELP